MSCGDISNERPFSETAVAPLFFYLSSSVISDDIVADGRPRALATDHDATAKWRRHVHHTRGRCVGTTVLCHEVWRVGTNTVEWWHRGTDWRHTMTASLTRSLSSAKHRTEYFRTVIDFTVLSGDIETVWFRWCSAWLFHKFDCSHLKSLTFQNRRNFVLTCWITAKKNNWQRKQKNIHTRRLQKSVFF